MNEVNLLATLTGHQNPIYCMALDATQHKLYSAGNDKGIVEWDLITKTFSRVLCAVPASVYHMSIMESTGHLIVALRKGGLLVIDRNEPKLVAKLAVEHGSVFAFEIISNKQEIIAVDEYGMAYVWSLVSYELLYSFRISTQTVRSIVVSFTDNRIYFGDKSGQIHMHSLVDYEHQYSAQIHEQNITALCLFGDKIISGSRDAKLYQLHKDTLVKEREITPHMFTVYSIVELEKANLFATISRDKTLKIWNHQFKLMKNISRDKGIDSHTLSINTMVYNSNTSEIYTAGDDKLIKVWQVN